MKNIYTITRDIVISTIVQELFRTTCVVLIVSRKDTTIVLSVFQPQSVSS